MLVGATSVNQVHRARIIDFAKWQRLPTIADAREFAAAGGLMSYGTAIASSYALLARYVDRILKGAKPSELPYQQPSRYELAINLKTAKALGVTIPRSLLLRADHVIE